MSAPGLRSFLDGREPYSATLRKLEVWYVGEFHRSAHSIDVDTARVALDLLMRDLPSGVNLVAVRESVRFLDELYGRLGADRPAWLEELRADFGAL